LDIGADGFNLDDDFILGDLWNFRFQPYNWFLDCRNAVYW
jgi:hypothetical protein